MQQTMNQRDKFAYKDRERLREYNTQRIIRESAFDSKPLSVHLASNPFLNDQEKYKFLIFKMNDYNRRVKGKLVTDPFEEMVYQRLHSIICDISMMETKQIQIEKLHDALEWMEQQQTLLDQRKDQGEIRYEVNKGARNDEESQRKEVQLSDAPKPDDIPSDVVYKLSLPYVKGWRTLHKELDIPSRRLNDYKRKILNIAPFIEFKDEKKVQTVLYPKMKRFDPKVEEPEEQNEENKEDGDAEAKQPGEDQDGGADPIEAEQQDLGVPGEEPAEPDEDQQPFEENAPRLKSFTLQKQNQTRKKPLKAGYMSYRCQQCLPECKIQQKYLKINANRVKKQREDIHLTQGVNQWAHSKSNLEKQRQKRLQNQSLDNKYVPSQQELPQKEMLNPQEEIKFGFATMQLRTRKKSDVDFSESTLPKISEQSVMYEKTIRKDRLKSLKNRFGKLLNLGEYEDRETAASICQYNPRKRGFSEVIRKLSKSKERLNQLDEVTRLKQKLAKCKIGIDIRSLSMGICLPEDYEKSSDDFFASKDLPSNPFMVETKKKKKKK